MVLSNKKLKQKLRAEIVESLTSSENPDPIKGLKADPDLNSKGHSLKQLLNSVTQKPRLSKREKKRVRTHDSLEDSETVSSKNRDGNNKNLEGEENEEGSKKRKRKINGDESRSLDLVGGGENGEKKKRKKKDKKEEGDEESDDAKEARKLKRKKIKKKQMKKKQRKANKHEENSKVDDGVVVNEDSNKGIDR